jgi:hypothetical protein
MGRSTYPIRGQRANLPADREVKRALAGSDTPSFGICRPLTGEFADTITGLLLDMQDTGELPDPTKLELRESELGITLLSRRVVAAQIQRGRVGRNLLGVARAEIIRSQSCEESGDGLEVKRGDLEVFRGRLVVARVESEALEGEIDAIHAALATAGLKGIATREKPHVPHLTLGQAAQGKMFSAAEQADMIATLERTLPEEIEVQGWRSYPFDIFEA